jgi:hypothetical protein
MSVDVDLVDMQAVACRSSVQRTRGIKNGMKSYLAIHELGRIWCLLSNAA